MKMDVEAIANAVAERLTPYLWNNAILDAVYPGERTINNDKEAFEIVKDAANLEQENLIVICLDTRNHVLAVERLYKGTVNQSTVRIAEIFRTAIRLNATTIIIAHNHPSGDPTPSPDDIAVTRAIDKAGKLLEINVLDHIIIGKMGRYTSLKFEGLF